MSAPPPSAAAPNALPPHPIPPEAEAYLATRSKDQLELHELAVKMLGSSYFIERTHGFAKWSATASVQSKK